MKKTYLTLTLCFLSASAFGGHFDALFSDLSDPTKYASREDCVRLFSYAKEFLEYRPSSTPTKSFSEIEPFDSAATSYGKIKIKAYQETLTSQVLPLERDHFQAKIKKWQAKNDMAESFVRMVYYWADGSPDTPALGSRWDSPFRHGSIESAISPNARLYLYWKTYLNTLQ